MPIQTSKKKSCKIQHKIGKLNYDASLELTYCFLCALVSSWQKFMDYPG